MRLYNKQKGFTLTPALFILVLLMIAGATYLIYITNTGRMTVKIEKSQAAKFAAERGLFHLKSQLAKLNKVDNGVVTANEWFKAKLEDNSNIFSSATDKISKLVEIKDGSTLVAKYRISLETGDVESTGKTITGSTQVGVDKYNNYIWETPINYSNKNFHKKAGFFRYGVRVDGFAVDTSGNIVKPAQSIYAVIDVPIGSDMNVFTNWSYGFPSDFLITTNGYEPGATPATDKYLTLLGGQIITGKVHSNNRIDFQWKGNFDIFNPNRTSINDKFTVTNGRWAAAADPSPMLVRSVVREQGDPVNRLTVQGTNFSLNLAKTSIVVNGSTAFNPVEVQQGMEGSPPTYTPTGFGTKIKFNLPASSVSPYTIDITNLERSQTIRYIINDSDINNIIPEVDPDNPPNTIPPAPLKIYGLMQVNDRRGFLSQRIYSQGTDYRFIGPPSFAGFNAPYIAWDLPGVEPNSGDFYETTYITEKNIPHNLIKVFDEITYSGYSVDTNLPNLYYFHAHKAPGTTNWPWNASHSHGEIFGMPGVNLLSPSSNVLDWDEDHRHLINSDLITKNFMSPNFYEDLFFRWGANASTPNYSLRPKNAPSKISPIDRPLVANYKTQRKYANQIIKIIFNKDLSTDVNGDFNSLDQIPDDRENGYYDMQGGMLDLRSSYFANDLKYSSGGYVLPPGSKITETKTIFVNDNPSDANYMKVENYAVNSNYHAYIYRQIPKNATSLNRNGTYSEQNGIIFVRDGVVRIGGANYKGNVVGTQYTNTLGNNTIIDGRLTIISYSEAKPVQYVDNTISTSTDNKGDIVITGNVIYKNRIKPWVNEVVKKDYTYNGFVQYKSSQNGLPTSSDYLTNSDGSTVNNNLITDKVNGLALIASNDIKIPVSHYRQPDNKENHYTTPAEEASGDCPCKDTITIQAQLIAGHQITQTKVEDGKASKNDRLILYGSIFSFYPPNLSYFDRSDPNNREEEGLGRIYLYDRTLVEMMLAGTPSFPKDNTYSSETYPVIGFNLPRIVPGTWKVVSDGAQ